jgi:hypothetical protein
MVPVIVNACAGRSATCSAWTCTSRTASSTVSASATHPQEQDTAHGTAMTARRILL